MLLAKYQNVNKIFITQSTITITFIVLCSIDLNKDMISITYRIIDAALPVHKNSLMLNRSIANKKMYFSTSPLIVVCVISNSDEIKINIDAGIIAVEGVAIIVDFITCFKIITTTLKITEMPKNILFVF